MHAVDEGLALVALAAAYIQFTVFAHLLRTRQGLQSRHDVAARITAHHHIERIHRLEVVALTEAVGTGRYHHLVDGCCPLVHLNGKVGELRGSQRIVIEAEVCHLQCHLTRTIGLERESTKGIGKTAIYRTYYIYIGTCKGFTTIGNGTGYCCLTVRMTCSEQDDKCINQSLFHAANIRRENDTAKYL